MKVSSLSLGAIRELFSVAFGLSKSGSKLAPMSNRELNLGKRFPFVGCAGDDACFITTCTPKASSSSSSSSKWQVCGIADGVGGWHQEGIDPSLFSTALMGSCASLATEEGLVRPAELLSAAFDKVLQDGAENYGSSTACLLSFDRGTSELHSANLGDSGFVVLRGGSLLYESKQMAHPGACPFQLAKPPPLQGYGNASDSPSAAELASMELQQGDLVVLATDGLFDNLFMEDMAKNHLNTEISDPEALMKTCVKLVETTRKLSLDEEYKSPFAKRIISWTQEIRGGKPDDITVILSTVL